MKILTAIANHGTKNNKYRDRLINEYKSMKYDVDIVILSDIKKDLGSDIEVKVGLPTENPWSLPFAHKQLFADRINDYDLFIYTEDDTLLQEKNIDAFLEMTDVLPENMIAGYLRYEEDLIGEKYCSTMHSFYHWNPDYVEEYGGETFAFYTNEHSALFILTQKQLHKVIASGGFLVPPHRGEYDMLVSAATDPYTQCGLIKMICISRIDDFLIHHIPDIYSENKGRSTLDLVTYSELKLQVSFLLNSSSNITDCKQLISPKTSLEIRDWDKCYYTHPFKEVIRMIPSSACEILSVGCADGKTEKVLIDRGHHVTGIPLDSIIGSLARNKGVQLTLPDFDLAYNALCDKKYDCILFLHILHHHEDSEKIIMKFSSLLNENGFIIISSPNIKSISIKTKVAKKVYHYDPTTEIQNFSINNFHGTSTKVLKKWHAKCNLKIVERCGIFSPKISVIDFYTCGMFFSFLANDIVYKSIKQ